MSKAKISDDLLDSSIVCGVQGCTLAHDQETLEVPRENASAVIGYEGIFSAIHSVPGLLVRHAEISGCKVDSLIGGLRSLVSGADPNFGTVGCCHVEEGRVIDFVTSLIEVLLGAIEAVVGGVVALNDEPVTGKCVIVDSQSKIGGVTASSVIVLVGRRQGKALIFNKETRHHVIIECVVVALGASEGAHGIHPARSGTSKILLADVRAKTSRDLVLAVSFDASNILDGKALD